MTKVLVYQAALYCAPCGAAIMTRLPKPDLAEDSNVYPQGPYEDGGGEADCPQHCDACGAFLENPLTPDGIRYVQDALREHRTTGRGSRAVLTQWAEFYASDLAAYPAKPSGLRVLTFDEDGPHDMGELDAGELDAFLRGVLGS